MYDSSITKILQQFSPGELQALTGRWVPDAHAQSWMEQYSCPHSIIGSVYAIHLNDGNDELWQSIEQAFNLIAWGGEPPHWAKSLGNSGYAKSGNVLLTWSDSYKMINRAGNFIIIPTAAIPERVIDGKLQAFKDQSKQPSRIRLKEIDIETICKNFETFAKPFCHRNETDEEYELRILNTFIKIFDYTRITNITNSGTIASELVSNNEPLTQSLQSTGVKQ